MGKVICRKRAENGRVVTLEAFIEVDFETKKKVLYVTFCDGVGAGYFFDGAACLYPKELAPFCDISLMHGRFVETGGIRILDVPDWRNVYWWCNLLDGDKNRTIEKIADSFNVSKATADAYLSALGEEWHDKKKFAAMCEQISADFAERDCACMKAVIDKYGLQELVDSAK